MNIDTVLDINFLSALLLGFSVGAVAGYIGSLMITKRMALMGGALGHLTLPGVALGLLYGFDVSLGAIIFLVIGIFAIWILEKITKLPFEATTAVVFTTSLAVAFLFLPHEETHVALLGDISHISPQIALLFFSVSVIVFFVIGFAYKKFVLVGISEDLGQVEGINVSRYNLIYLLCIALVVALGVRIIGGLMTAALVAIPAASSKNISSSLHQYAFLSSLFGCLSCVIGIFISHSTGLPVGPMIIISSAVFFVGTLFLKKAKN